MRSAATEEQMMVLAKAHVLLEQHKPLGRCQCEVARKHAELLRALKEQPRTDDDRNTYDGSLMR